MKFQFDVYQTATQHSFSHDVKKRAKIKIKINLMEWVLEERWEIQINRKEEQNLQKGFAEKGKIMRSCWKKNFFYFSFSKKKEIIRIADERTIGKEGKKDNSWEFIFGKLLWHKKVFIPYHPPVLPSVLLIIFLFSCFRCVFMAF